MKKLISVLLCITVMSVLAACGANTSTAKRDTGSQPTSVESVMADQMAKEDAAKNGESETVAVPTVIPTPVIEESITEADRNAMKHDGIDVDLTAISSTMVYSEVYNMMVTPKDYEGKVVKMNGTFNSYTDENTGMTYYFCIIQDATSCCAQGMEFVLTDENAYPNIGDNVTVMGTFMTYMEGEDMYCTLKDSQIVS